jgi:REP element-mobilizing transposase RayT
VDRNRFIDQLTEAVEACGVRLYMFCLMGNHVHLLLESPQANLSAFMQKLATAYAVYFNRRHRRVGHLTQGRYAAEPVQGDEYLRRLSRYLHLNPVRVGAWAKATVAERWQYLRRYPWSSYRGYAGLAKSWGFVDEGPLLAMTGAPPRRQRREYRRFVEMGLATSDEELQNLLGDRRWGIGDPEFQARMRALHSDMAMGVRRPEDVAFRRVELQVDPAAVLGAVAQVFGRQVAELRKRQYGCVARAVAALLLGRLSGMNQRDVAGYLVVGTGSAVCRMLRRLREQLAEDAVLRQKLARVQALLTKEPRRGKPRHSQLSRADPNSATNSANSGLISDSMTDTNYPPQGPFYWMDVRVP